MTDGRRRRRTTRKLSKRPRAVRVPGDAVPRAVDAAGVQEVDDDERDLIDVDLELDAPDYDDEPLRGDPWDDEDDEDDEPEPPDEEKTEPRIEVAEEELDAAGEAGGEVMHVEDERQTDPRIDPPDEEDEPPAADDERQTDPRIDPTDETREGATGREDDEKTQPRYELGEEDDPLADDSLAAAPAAAASDAPPPGNGAAASEPPSDATRGQDADFDDDEEEEPPTDPRIDVDALAEEAEKRHGPLDPPEIAAERSLPSVIVSMPQVISDYPPARSSAPPPREPQTLPEPPRRPVDDVDLDGDTLPPAPSELAQGQGAPAVPSDEPRAAVAPPPPPPEAAAEAPVADAGPPPPPEVPTDGATHEKAAAREHAPDEDDLRRTPPPPPPPPSAVAKPRKPPPPPPREPQTDPPTPGKKRKRSRQWWERFFSDDYLMSVIQPTPAQIARQVDFAEQSMNLRKGSTVLDVGCGLGLHSLELARRGHLPVGLDLSLPMITRAAEQAQQLGLKINFVHADLREIEFDGAFDGVMCLGTTFGFFDDEANRDVLKRLHKALRPGGRVLIDVVNRDHVLASQPNLVWFQGADCVCMEESDFNYFTSRLHVKRTLMQEDGRQSETEYSIRLYALHELGQMMQQCGFRVIEVSGQEATRNVFFGVYSSRIVMLAERRVPSRTSVMVPPDRVSGGERGRPPGGVSKPPPAPPDKRNSLSPGDQGNGKKE